MQGSQFSRIASIANLSKIDLAPRDVHLRSEGGMVYATYSGVYASGTIKVQADLPLVKCSVRADQLINVSSLFDSSGELDISTARTSVTISSSDRSANLRRLAAADDYDEIVGDEPDVIVNRGAFTSEVNVAAEFVSDQSHIRILEGIRLMVSPTQVAISAFDAKSGLYAGSIPAKAVGKFDMTIPAKDLSTALGIFTGEEVGIAVRRNSAGDVTQITLSSDDTVIKLALIIGEWPKFGSLLSARERTTITVKSDRLSLVLQALKGLGAEKDGAITLATDEDGLLRARTVETDLGVFSIAIGDVASKPLHVTFDPTVIKLAATMGDELAIGVADDNSGVLIQSAARRYWATLRAREA